MSVRAAGPRRADVLIVGAGPGGASLAAHLGRAGVAVALFDKARFPRDKACGEGLMPSGVGALHRLGLTDALAHGAPFWGVRYHAGGRVATGRFSATAGLPNFGLGQRRLHLDARLADLARACPNVAFHEGTGVDRLVTRQGRVVGLEAGGEAWEAPLVVLAGGLHTPLRRQAGLEGPPVARPRLGLRAHYRLAGGQAPPPPWVEVFLAERRRELYVTPLPDGELLVAALAERDDVGGPPARAFEAWVRAEPVLAARLEGAIAVSPVIGMAPLETRPAAGVGPGVALLGDTAGFIDPITGGGMAQALLSAELLARHVPAFLADPAGPALGRFEAERRWLLRDYRLLTRAVMGLADHPRAARAAIALLAAQPALFGHLLGVSAGVRPIWRVW